jgi:hypothetical protein
MISDCRFQIADCKIINHKSKIINCNGGEGFDLPGKVFVYILPYF